MIKYLLCILTISIFFACSPARRAQRHIDKAVRIYPDILKKDSIIDKDTIRVSGIDFSDTLELTVNRQVNGLLAELDSLSKLGKTDTLIIEKIRTTLKDNPCEIKGHFLSKLSLYINGISKELPIYIGIDGKNVTVKSPKTTFETEEKHEFNKVEHKPLSWMDRIKIDYFWIIVIILGFSAALNYSFIKRKQ